MGMGMEMMEMETETGIEIKGEGEEVEKTDTQGRLPSMASQQSFPPLRSLRAQKQSCLQGKHLSL